MRRVLGVIMIVIGLTGVVLSATGVIVGRTLVDDIGTSLDANLALTLESLETVKETLVLTKGTVGQLADGLQTVQQTADNVAQTMEDTRPMLRQVGQVTSEQVPAGIESFQETIPTLIEVSTTIDETLTKLNDVQFEQSILGIPLSFDLGIDYAPEVPLYESVQEMGAALEGMPEQLRELGPYIEMTDQNLESISGNLTDITDNLSAVNDDVAQLEPLVDDYIVIVTEATDSIRTSRRTLSQQLDTAKLGLTIIMVWMGLTQIAPLYLGWELVTGQRTEDVDDVDV